MKNTTVLRTMFYDVLEVAVETVTFLAYIGAAISGDLKAEEKTPTGDLKEPQYAAHSTKVAEEEKPSYEFMLKASGVTHEGRQAVISELKDDSEAVLAHMPTEEYPYRTEVKIGGNLIGYLPDTQRASMAKMLMEKQRRGKVISIPRWFKVGGHDGSKYGLRLIIKVEG